MMHSIKSHLLYLGILFTQTAICQNFDPAQEQNQSDTIPFYLSDHNNIVIEAIVNKTDTVKLMFHTAATNASLIKSTTAQLNSITWENMANAKGWGGQGETRYSSNNSLRIHHLEWKNIELWENTNSGPGTDGKFGPFLFKDKYIEVNYDNHIMVIHNKIPDSVKNFDKLDLTYKHGFMFIYGTSKIGEKEIPNNYLIHSGYSGTILYDDDFVKENTISNHIEITEEQILKDSFGNSLKTKKGNLKSFRIGQEEFKDVSVGFFEGAIGRQKMSVIGGGLLKRFNFIIDAKREYIYIQPSTLKG